MYSYFGFFLFILIGLYAIAGAAFSMDWFLKDPVASVFVRLLGKKGTRIFYGILGISLIFVGVWGMFGMPE